MSRGPSYPFVDLEEALTITRKIYDFAKRSAAPTDSVVQHALGYSLKSSGGQKTIAALRSYGLIEESGTAVKITDRAYRILIDTPDSPDRKQAVRDAALSPRWYETVFKEWGVDPPASARSTLVLEHSFVPTTVDAFLKGFRKSMQFAELSNADQPAASAIANKETSRTELKVGSLVQWEGGGVLKMPHPRRLASFSEDGKWAFVEGSSTGIPVDELIAAEESDIPNNFTNGFISGNSGAGSDPASKLLVESFKLASGIACQLQWPSLLKQEDYEDLVYQLEGLQRKINRSVQKHQE